MERLKSSISKVCSFSKVLLSIRRIFCPRSSEPRKTYFPAATITIQKGILEKLWKGLQEAFPTGILEKSAFTMWLKQQRGLSRRTGYVQTLQNFESAPERSVDVDNSNVNSADQRTGKQNRNVSITHGHPSDTTSSSNSSMFDRGLDHRSQSS